MRSNVSNKPEIFKSYCEKYIEILPNFSQISFNIVS